MYETLSYPPEIYLDEETERNLIAYLDVEIMTHRAEKTQMIQELSNLQADYLAKPATEMKQFPFEGACNIVIPLNAIVTEATHAREMMTFFALDQMVSAKMVPALQPIDRDLERYLDWELLNGIKIWNFADNTLLEKTKLGNCVGKVTYEKISKTLVQQIGQTEQEIDLVISRGAKAIPIPTANFCMPFYAQDPQLAPWCGEEHLKNWYDFQLLCESGLIRKSVLDQLMVNTPSTPGNGESGMMPNTMTTSDRLNNASTTYLQLIEQKTDTSPSFPKEVAWVELWMAFNVDKNSSGKMREICVHYHWQRKLLMSVRNNWFTDGRRPYRIGKHFPIENRWRALGVGQQQEQFQMEITTQHRQRIDNVTLANSRMLKARKMSGIAVDEPVSPAKIWLLDDMSDLEAFQFGEVYTSAFNQESSTQQYAQQRSGINELTLGQPQVGTPGTATGDMARVQEANRKFDYNHRNSAAFLNDILQDVILTICQYGHRDIRYFDYINNGPVVKEFFNQPFDLIKNRIIADFKIVGQNQNKLLDRQNLQAVGQQLQQYYTGLVQLATMTQNQQLLQEVMKRTVTGSTEMLKQILETYDISDINRILIDLNAITQQLSQPGGNQTPPQAIPAAGNTGIT